ncbi:MAG: DMT family transporter [Rickettsiales bacterium]|nr:DMT family transporter [Rickettsiales bacterium]
MNNNIRNFLLLVALALCWGPSFLFIKVAVVEVPPIALTAIRMAIGSLILFSILKFKRVKLPKLKPILAKFTIAALLQGAIPFTLFAVAERSTDSSFAAIFSGAVPLFTMILAHFFIKNDSLTKVKFFGAIIGFVGLFLLIIPSANGSNSDIFGSLVLLAAATFYAVAFVYAKKFIDVKSYPDLVIPAIQCFISFVVLTIFSLIFENPFVINYISPAAIFSLLGLGIFGTALAFVIYYKLISLTNVSYISMVNYIVPVFGAFLGMIILNEKLTWTSYLGATLILLGVLVASNLLKTRLSS